MFYDRKTRRQFLQGAGSAALALPFLTSLWPRSAWGQTPGDKRFIAVWAPFGCFDAADLYPTYTPTTAAQLASHRIHSSPLTLSPSLGSISKIYSSALNPFLAKLNLIQGLDCPIDFTHGENTFLGHYRFPRGHSHEDLLSQYPDVASIDQLLAFHSKFYPTPPAARSINGFDSNAGTGRVQWKDPNDRSKGTQLASIDTFRGSQQSERQSQDQLCG